MSIVIYDNRATPLFIDGQALTKLATGATWSEGPLYIEQTDTVIWSDIPNNRIVSFNAKDGFGTYLSPSHFSNGRTIDLNGDIITCEHGRRCISKLKIGQDGKALDTQILVDKWQGKKLNSPNDVVVKSDGSIWFSDPQYGIMSDKEGYKADSEIGSDNVYRFDPSTGEITAVITDTERPNGLAFSPDESLLYVTDTSASHSNAGRHEIRVYQVNQSGDGIDGTGKLFAGVSPGLPDGFRIDARGFLYVSSADSVQIFHPDGTLLARILVPEVIANLTFGGQNFDTLYIVATSSLYTIRLNTQAALQRRATLHPKF